MASVSLRFDKTVGTASIKSQKTQIVGMYVSKLTLYFLRAVLYLISLQNKVQTNVNLLSSTFYDLLSLHFDQYSLCLILSQQPQFLLFFD